MIDLLSGESLLSFITLIVLILTALFSFTAALALGGGATGWAWLFVGLSATTELFRLFTFLLPYSVFPVGEIVRAPLPILGPIFLLLAALAMNAGLRRFLPRPKRDVTQ